MIINSYRYAGGAAPGGLLLDTYPNALLAVSFSRSLKTGEAGGAIIRETNTSTTQQISAIDIQSGVAASFVGAGNNGVVQTMIDQSGNGYDLEETRAAEQLRIVTNGLLETGAGGKAALKEGTAGNTSNQYTYSIAIGTAMAATNEATLVYVDTGSRRALFSNGANYENRGIPSISSEWKNANFLQSAPISPTLFTVTQTAAGDVVVRQNGVVEATFNTTNLWEINTGPFFRFIADIQFSELILWDKDYSANIAAIETDVATHYGITL